MPYAVDRLQALLGPRYRLQHELAGGSMSAVYLAEDTRHGRPVAIKVLHTEYATSFAAERFLREIEIVARLQHPHIVPLLDSGEVGGTPYLVLPYIEGDSLRRRLSREGPLPVADVVRIVGDVADALAHAHGRGIVHRDIKPDNILITGRHALVADFGVAKAVSAATVTPRQLTAGVAIGTPAYMAPEQATADPGQDHRVDLYALGVVAYELLTGRPPFDGETAQQILTAHVLEQPVPVNLRRPEVPPALAATVMRALAKRPDERWQSAEAILHQLEPLSTPGRGVPPTRTSAFSRRQAAWVVGVAAGVAVLFAGVRYTLDRAGRSATLRPVNQEQLTFVGNVTAAALSPDGQMMAYVTDGEVKDQLRVQDLRGGAPVVVAEARRIGAPSWSSDGTEIRYPVLEDPSGSLQAVPRLGGPPRLVWPQRGAALSPDGAVVAAAPQGLDSVSFIDLRRNTREGAVRLPYRWHSEGSWSPAADRIAYAAGSPELGLYAVVSVVRAPLRYEVLYQDTLALGTPAWSGSGRSLYFLRAAGSLSDLMKLELDAAGRARGAPLVLVPGIAAAPEYEAQLSLTRDGQRMVYARRADWSNLETLTLDDWRRGRPARALTSGSARYPAARLSPDGRQVAFVRGDADALSIGVLPLGGGPGREIARVKEAGEPAWSPDGQRLAVAVQDTAQGLGLALYPLGGGPARLLAKDLVGWSAGWGAGSEVAVQRVGNRSLLLVNPVDGKLRQIPGIDTTGWAFWPRFSPDGRSIAFSWSRGPRGRGVYVYSAGDSAPRPLPGSSLLVVREWSRDGRTIYAATNRYAADSTRLYAMPAAGGAARLLATLSPDDEVLDVAPDGTLLLLNHWGIRADAWALLDPDPAP